MKILIDMNLSPEWVEVFLKEGWEALHWSSVGRPNDPDPVIMQWAKSNSYLVFTHDPLISAPSWLLRKQMLQVFSKLGPKT